MHLDAYREEAERFVAAITREFYEHYAGHKGDFEIEAIYDRHADLFARDAVERLRERAAAAPAGDEGRRARFLLDFAVEGHLGLATRDLDARSARREAELEVEVEGERIGFRESPAVQANEPDPDRRGAIEAARLEVTARELNPLRELALERMQELARELGWRSYSEMCSELKGIDLVALEGQTSAFTAGTRERYPEVIEPELQRSLGVGLRDLRRCDLPWFFRAAWADECFPADRLVPAFTDTLAGLGIDLGEQANVRLDVEPRQGKSPRAFCAPVLVPGEVHLVVSPVGGRDDYAALLHEGGHAEHYGHVDARAPFEFRRLGDTSVTEAFAFLFDHLTEDPEWLRRRLGVEDAEDLVGHARAQRLLFLRRYAAKLAYELELHGVSPPAPDALAGRYAELLTEAVGVPWPRETFLVDVDPGFYAAGYLRAWALETHLRAVLRERFGAAWFEAPEAGAWLRGLWAQGQRLDAAELLAEIAGESLDFGALVADLEL